MSIQLAALYHPHQVPVLYSRATGTVAISPTCSLSVKCHPVIYLAFGTAVPSRACGLTHRKSRYMQVVGHRENSRRGIPCGVTVTLGHCISHCSRLHIVSKKARDDRHLRPSAPHKKRKSDQKPHHNAHKCNTAAASAAPFVSKRASTPLLFVHSPLNRAYFHLQSEVRRGRGKVRTSNENGKQGYCLRRETCLLIILCAEKLINYWDIHRCVGKL